jgi:hypothetical protein
MQFDKLGATTKTYLTGSTGFDGSTASDRSRRAARNTHPLLAEGDDRVNIPPSPQAMAYCLSGFRLAGNIEVHPVNPV